MNLCHRFIKWFFSVPDGDRSTWDIIFWWEARRIPYNVIVGTVGVLSLLLFYLFSAHEPIENGEDIGEPITILLAPLVINICYTAGWIVEGFFPAIYLDSFFEERQALGSRLLRFGLQLSLVIVFLPTTVWAILWLLHIFGLRS
jgi:hypothetical protein